MILTLLIMVYSVLVIAGVAYALKYYGLLVKAPDQQLKEKVELANQAAQILRDALCPFCGARTNIKKIDLFYTNTATLNCNVCGKESLWKLVKHKWYFIAPLTPMKLRKASLPFPEEKIGERKVVVG